MFLRLKSIFQGFNFVRPSSSTNIPLLAILPFFIISQQELTKTHCFFSKSNKKNLIENRISLIQYESNSPIEDRYSCVQIKEIDGYLISVFDGHGGWQVAEYARDNIAQEFQNRISINKALFSSKDEAIVQSLKETYNVIENNILQVAQQAYKIGFYQTSKVGACALTVFVHDNKVYVANAGDCKGIILRMQKDKTFQSIKINHKLNANSKKEQKRLKAQFPDENDIYVCKRGNADACYVKNALQPTRSFGDFRLKYPEFNNPKNYNYEYGFPRKIQNFKGPYITHEPEIKIFDVTKDDKFIVMGSDGLWDELNKNDIASIVSQNSGDRKIIAQTLLDAALKNAAANSKLTLDELKKLPTGSIRRKKHDDITLIVVDLTGQTN